MQSAQGAEEHLHRRAGVPDPLQPVALRPDHDRCHLTTRGPKTQRGEIVGRQLEREQQVVDVLDVHDRPETAHRSADPLPEDRRLADAGVVDAQCAVLLLKPLVHEIDVAESSDVFAEDDDALVARQVRVEAAKQHEAAVDHIGFRRVLRRDLADAQR